jgi:hypothetical protein
MHTKRAVELESKMTFRKSRRPRDYDTKVDLKCKVKIRCNGVDWTQVKVQWLK